MNYREKYKRMLDEIGTSREKAIKAHCYQCSGYNYRIARECTLEDCALYVVNKNIKDRKKKGDQE